MDTNISSIYEDYEAFRRENNEFITKLIEDNSKTVQRFTHVIKVVNHLYDLSRFKKLNEDEEVFFETGFDYIFDQIHILYTLFEMKFDKDYKEMEKVGKSINLLLYINEFKSESLNLSNPNKKALDKLLELESRVDKAIDNKEIVPDEYFQILNDIVDDLFYDTDLTTVCDIFYEIALEYDLVDDLESDIDFNEIISEKINR